MRLLFITLLALTLSACSGETKEDTPTSEAPTLPAGSEVIGHWTDPTALEPGEILIYNKGDGTLMVRSILAGDNGFYEYEVREESTNGSRSFVYVEAMHGEYFVINEIGELEFKNAAGKTFGVGTPISK